MSTAGGVHGAGEDSVFFDQGSLVSGKLAAALGDGDSTVLFDVGSNVGGARSVKSSHGSDTVGICTLLFRPFQLLTTVKRAA